jgi:hypothetical protein
MVCRVGPSMSACVVGVPMCCRELLVMVLLDNPGSVGTAIIGLWFGMPRDTCQETSDASQ